MRRLLLLIGLLLVPTIALSQANATESQNLKALLDEVRQLRRTMQMAMVAGQRVQIALYRLQLQDAALARASKAAGEAHSKLTELADNRKHITAQQEQAEAMRARTEDPNERKTIEEEALPQFKRLLEQLSNDEQQWQAGANEADNRVRIEQGKLDALHALLDQLDQALQKAGDTK